MRAREPTAGMISRMHTRAYVDVGAGVGVSVGEGVGEGVGDGVGSGVGLKANATACSMLPLNVRPTIPLVAAQVGLTPGADVDQCRRSPSAVPAQMWTSSVTSCVAAHACVPVRAHMHASSCMPVHACP